MLRATCPSPLPRPFRNRRQSTPAAKPAATSPPSPLPSALPCLTVRTCTSAPAAPPARQRARDARHRCAAAGRDTQRAPSFLPPVGHRPVSHSQSDVQRRRVWRTRPWRHDPPRQDSGLADGAGRAPDDLADPRAHPPREASLPPACGVSRPRDARRAPRTLCAP